MSVIWIIEQVDSPQPNLAGALIGDYAVRAFASLDSFTRLLRISRNQLPDLLLIDAATQRLPTRQVLDIVACHLPQVPVVYVRSSDRSTPVAAGGEASHLRMIDRPADNLELSHLVKGLLNSGEVANPRSIVRYRSVLLDYQRLEYVIAPSEEGLSLPRREAQLLRLLMQRPGVCLGRDEIRTRVWEDVHVTPRTIDSHMSRLRQRLEGSEVQIITVYAGGYMLR